MPEIHSRPLRLFLDGLILLLALEAVFLLLPRALAVAMVCFVVDDDDVLEVEKIAQARSSIAPSVSIVTGARRGPAQSAADLGHLHDLTSSKRV